MGIWLYSTTKLCYMLINSIWSTKRKSVTQFFWFWTWVFRPNTNTLRCIIPNGISEYQESLEQVKILQSSVNTYFAVKKEPHTDNKIKIVLYTANIKEFFGPKYSMSSSPQHFLWSSEHWAAKWMNSLLLERSVQTGLIWVTSVCEHWTVHELGEVWKLFSGY